MDKSVQNSREEVIHYDNLNPCEEIVNYSESALRSLSCAPSDHLSDASALMSITSTGRYSEGSGFRAYHYGFYNYALIVTLNGFGYVELRGQRLLLKRGDIVFANNYEPSTYGTEGDSWSFSAFNISGAPCRLYDFLWNHGGMEIIHIANPEQIEDYRRRINRAISQPGGQNDLEVNRILTNALTDLLAIRNDSSDETEKQPAWVAEAAAYIAAHYSEPLTISDVAEHFFLNADHFTRQFKRFTGRTPKEYLTLCRIDEAALLLRGSALPIMEIAARTGFTSHSRFTEVFRHIYGLSPTDYRKNDSEI